VRSQAAPFQARHSRSSQRDHPSSQLNWYFSSRFHRWSYFAQADHYVSLLASLVESEEVDRMRLFEFGPQDDTEDDHQVVFTAKGVLS
jgi:hypothetical protein